MLCEKLLTHFNTEFLSLCYNHAIWFSNYQRYFTNTDRRANERGTDVYNLHFISKMHVHFKIEELKLLMAVLIS